MNLPAVVSVEYHELAEFEDVVLSESEVKILSLHLIRLATLPIRTAHQGGFSIFRGIW